jgi:pyruvate/2-oxoglutarate dehydrogenase complex dihydrolipoamide acyltransferase (E2) component
VQRAGSRAVTLNDVIIHAAAQTMAEFPDVNVHIDGDEVVQAQQVDVSIAVATDRGLRTPVLADIGRATLQEVADASRKAIEASREGRAAAGRASLTISNLGRYGVRSGTPVLNLDETVLLFVGSIDQRAVVAEGAVVARPQLTLSIAFDHRARTPTPSGWPA